MGNYLFPRGIKTTHIFSFNLVMSKTEAKKWPMNHYRHFVGYKKEVSSSHSFWELLECVCGESVEDSLIEVFFSFLQKETLYLWMKKDVFLSVFRILPYSWFEFLAIK